MKRLSIVMPAALVPVMIVPLHHLHVSDAFLGLTIGVLLGLSLLGMVRRRRCATAG